MQNHPKFWIQPYDGIEDAVRNANDTSLWSRGLRACGHDRTGSCRRCPNPSRVGRRHHADAGIYIQRNEIVALFGYAINNFNVDRPWPIYPF